MCLSGNSIGDVGLSALADCVSRGALAQLTELGLSENGIGNAGITALATAMGSGALDKLEILHIFSNQIGDVGVQALPTFFSSNVAQCFQKQVHGQQQPPVQCYVHPPVTTEHF